MKAQTLTSLLLSIAAVATLGQQSAQTWEEAFKVDKVNLATTGTNDYFLLVPGFKAEFEGGNTRLVITVLDRTRKVDGVMTRVVEEREYEDGKIIEVSRNYFAIDIKTNDVYYFGEDVDMYKDGKVVGHEGAWHASENGAKFGLMMPGKPTVGRAYYQEIAPATAMDRAKITSVSGKLKTPAGEYSGCVVTEETTPLEPNAKETKTYAAGVGLIQDADVKLVKLTRP